MKARFHQSLSFRLALAYAAILCGSVLLLSAAYWWMAVAQPLDRLKDQVNRDAQILAQVYIVDGEAALLPRLMQREEARGTRKAFHALIAPDGTLIAGNLPSWPARPAAGWFSIEADVYRDGDEQDFSALSRGRQFRNGARLIVGLDAEDIEDREEIMVLALPWMLGLTALFGLVGGLLMSRAIGRRLESFSLAARQIMGGDLAGRIPVSGSGDDFDRLAATLNAMLARNQELFEAVRRVSDNVAHELRTPLARLVARLEMLEPSAREDQRADMEGALAEANRLQAIFNALLRISRLEGGRHDGSFQPIDLAVLAADAYELYRPAAEAGARNLVLEAEPGCLAPVDADLMFQALANLLDNALKFTPAGGTVWLRLGREPDGSFALAVVDNGPGVAGDETGHMTERFFRGAAAHGVPGEGLGLSLVAAIARLHGARLTIANNHPGLGVTLNVQPASPAARQAGPRT